MACLPTVTRTRYRLKQDSDMAIGNLQRLSRILFKIAESDDATIEQKLAATTQLVDLTRPKAPKVGRPKKSVSSLLGTGK